MAVKKVVTTTMAAKVITMAAIKQGAVTSNSNPVVVVVTIPMTVDVLISHVSFVEKYDIQRFAAGKGSRRISAVQNAL
jgi:hypothetical protein